MAVSPAFIATPLPRGSALQRQTARIPKCASAPPTPRPTAVQPLRTPVHRRLPLIGFLLDVFVRKVNNITLARRYGPVYKTDVLGVFMTIIADLDAIKSCYKDVDTFRSVGAYPPVFDTFFGKKSLFNQDGREHSEQRASILPAFSPQLFPLYFEVIRDASVAVWDRVGTHLQESGPTDLKTIIKDHYLRITLSITAGDDYVTGPASDSTTAEEQYLELRDEFLKFANGPFVLPGTPAYRKALKSRDWLRAKISTLICDRLARRTDTITALRAVGPDQFVTTARADLRTGALDLLTVMCASSSLETGAGVTHDPVALEELAEFVLLLWNAGYSTQSSSTLCCIMEAAKDKAIWKRLQQEQDELVEASGARRLTLDQVTKEMPLLDSFVTEVLRLYPPAAVYFRKASKPAVVKGHKIEAGTTVGLDPWAAQRDARYYPDPDKLRVDRFVPRDGELAAPVPPAITTFGAVGGVHFCIGAALAKITMKATLGTLLRDFVLVLQPGQDMTYQVLPEMIPASGVVVGGCERRKVGVNSVATVE